MPAPSVAAPASSEPPLQPALEAARGVAAALVVVAHYAPIAGVSSGWTRYTFTGVDLFFVLTGYVFASTWLRADAPVTWRGYAVRRIGRLMPLYVLAVLAYAALNLLQGAGSEQLRWVGLHLVFAHTLQSREIAFSLNPAFWSLPVEVAFYLALPVLAALYRVGLPWALMLCGALTVQAVVACAARDAGAVITPAFLLSVHLPGLLGSFALGAAAWRVAQHGVSRATAAVLMLAGLGLWVLAAHRYGQPVDAALLAAPLAVPDLSIDTVKELAVQGWTTAVRTWPGLMAALAMALVLAGLGGWRSGATTAAASPWRRGGAWIGLQMGALSYGVYLFHNLMPRALAGLQDSLGAFFLPVCALATVLLAALLHKGVEAPTRAWARARAREIERAAASR
jgi:peptidoglycan/LPS O-acetylase OafA/YrhL